MHPHLFEPQLSTPSTVVTVQLGYLIIPHNRLFSNEFKGVVRQYCLHLCARNLLAYFIMQACIVAPGYLST